MPDSNIFDSTGTLTGLVRRHRGKVRDTYRILETFQPHDFEVSLVVASDRISVFDFVLPAHVADKGAILNAMNIFWRLSLGAVHTDLIAYGPDIDRFLPQNLRGSVELQSRAVVVKRLRMIPVEAIVRGYLTGSGLASYKKDGTVCGHELPPGLHDGSRLETPIFTPTTKAEVGHDEHMDVAAVRSRYPKLEELALSLYRQAHEAALERGVIIADTKFEIGEAFEKPGLVLADEVLTPDSSRFWHVEEYEAAAAEGKSPKPHDKQFVRDYMKGQGVDKLDPQKPEDVAKVRTMMIDPVVLIQTTRLYHEIFAKLAQMNLRDFQRDIMLMRI